MDSANLPSYSPGFALPTQETHMDTAAPSIHASLNNPCWPSSQPSPTHHTSLFPLQSRVSDLDYPSPASSVPSPPYQRHSHQHAAVNNSAITSDKDMHVPFPQVEPVIGPDRILTRRQRAALDQSTLGRRMSGPSSLARGDRQDPAPRHRSDLYFPSSVVNPRPHTPVNIEATKAQAQRDRLSLSIADSNLVPNHSPGYKPMTPTSLASPYSPYPYYPNQARSEASTQAVVEPRQGSPSNSIASSLSGAPFEGGPIRTSATQHSTPAPRVKHKKQRLCNAQRKDICVYAEENPNARQEDMAMLWQVERSTVSKILKNRDKWLRLPQDDYNYIAKHRHSKFPEIEADLEPWLEECHNKQIVITDALIRTKAKEVAQRLHIPEERFKASSGWIENFKLRQGIKSGKLTGDGKEARLRNIYATMSQHNMAGDASPSTRDTTFPATDSRLNSHTLGYQQPSLPGYPQTTRQYHLLEGASALHDAQTSQHVRSDNSFPPRFPTNQHAASDFNTDTIQQAYEALGRVRHFLETYHRKDYLINIKDDDMLAKLAQRFSGELAGTIIDKA
ncbi:hypothetical protein APHAL10511_002576 [Amanita phalloides]|nr:hypothetical protein APHAL10511_002576 [Amanita phalloides]